MLLEVTDIDAC